MWLTPEQEQQFKERFGLVYRYASRIDDVTERDSTMDDYTFWVIWNEHKEAFSRLPRFRVRTDIEGESGKVPPRTGVYIPQDDPWGTPQFAWAGGEIDEDGSRWYDGQLGDAVTFNALGVEIMETIGRSHIWPWDDGAAAVEYLRGKGIRNLFGEEVEDEREAAGILNAVATVDGPFNPAVIGVKQTTRPCEWYYVEQLEGEYEDTNEPEVAMVPRRGPGMYAKTGEHCPYPGVWECVERPVGTQTIAYGVPMPQVDGHDVTWRLKKGI
jgi:hypothetical protein